MKKKMKFFFFGFGQTAKYFVEELKRAKKIREYISRPYRPFSYKNLKITGQEFTISS